MESRRLIQFGKSSLIVSLPKSWIERNNLKKGDEVYLNVHSDELSFYPKEKSHEEAQKEITIVITGKDERMLDREIKSAYINNYNSITFVGEGIKLKSKEIRKIIQDLIAIEIMEQTSTKIVARDFLNMSQISIEGLIRKMDIVIRDMMSDVRKATKQEHYENIVHQDDDVNRLSYLAFRAIRYAINHPIVARSMEMNEINLLDIYRLCEYLENIADESKRIARYSVRAKMSDKQKESLIEILTKIEKIYVETMKAYYTNNRESSLNLANNRKFVFDECDKFLHENEHIPYITNLTEKMKNLIALIHHVVRISYNKI